MNVEIRRSTDNQHITQLRVMHVSAVDIRRRQRSIIAYIIIEDYARGDQQLPKALHVNALALVAVEVDSRIFEQVDAVVCIHVL